MTSEKALLIQSQTKEVCDNLIRIKAMVEGNIAILADNRKIAKVLGNQDVCYTYDRAMLDLQSALSGLRCASNTMDNVSKVVKHLK